MVQAYFLPVAPSWRHTAVGLGQGIAFVAGAAGELFPRPGIRYLEVADLPPSSALLTWAASRRDEPGLVAIRGVVREVCATAAVARLGARWWDTPAPSDPRP